MTPHTGVVEVCDWAPDGRGRTAPCARQWAKRCLGSRACPPSPSREPWCGPRVWRELNTTTP